MTWLKIGLSIYAVGFVLVFWFNMAIGPIEASLCLLRAAVWPVYVTTGWPRGYPARMD